MHCIITESFDLIVPWLTGEYHLFTLKVNCLEFTLSGPHQRSMWASWRIGVPPIITISEITACSARVRLPLLWSNEPIITHTSRENQHMQFSCFLRRNYHSAPIRDRTCPASFGGTVSTTNYQSVCEANLLPFRSAYYFRISPVWVILFPPTVYY